MKRWMMLLLLCFAVVLGEEGNTTVCKQMKTQSLEERTENVSLEYWHMESIDCSDMLGQFALAEKTPGEGVIVAVIDTGLNINCDVLKDALWCNEAELLGTSKVDDDGNGYVDDIYGCNLANTYHNMTDTNGHGTQMASIIAGRAVDGVSCGIAYGAKIMPIKVSVDTNYDVDTVIEAIHYAVNMGADVINLSCSSYYESEKLREAVNEASKSCVIVAAAGNESYVTKGERLDSALLLSDGYKIGDTYPASWDSCIGVMAYDMNEQLAEFSNFDQSAEDKRKYDIIAPGQKIYSVTKSGAIVYNSGTSQATAIVSACVAVLKSMTGEQYNAEQLKNLFLQSMEQRVLFSYGGENFAYPKCSLANIGRYLGEKGDEDQDKNETSNDDLGGNKDTEESENKDTEESENKDTEESENKDTEESENKDTEESEDKDTEESEDKDTEESEDKDTEESEDKDTEESEDKDTEESENKGTEESENKDTEESEDKDTEEGENKDTEESEKKEENGTVDGNKEHTDESKEPNNKINTQEKEPETQKENTNSSKQEKTIKKGTVFIYKKLKYKVLSNNTLSCIGIGKKNLTSVTIPASVKKGDKNFKVISIEKKAFYKNRKIKKVRIGKNIQSIGKNAFYGINKKAIFYIEKKKKKIQKKLLTKKTGFLKKTMKICYN